MGVGSPDSLGSLLRVTPRPGDQIPGFTGLEKGEGVLPSQSASSFRYRCLGLWLSSLTRGSIFPMLVTQTVGGRRSGAGRQVRGTVAAREAKKRRPPRARLRPAGKGLPAAAPGRLPARPRAELSRTELREARGSAFLAPLVPGPARTSSCLRGHLIGAAGSIFQRVKLRMRKSRGPGSCARRTPAPSAFRFPGCGWSPSRAPASAARMGFTCACRPVPLPTAFSSGRASSTACVPCPPRPETPPIPPGEERLLGGSRRAPGLQRKTPPLCG
ncbi:atherin-like [Pongo pygmaeus]|uniref:atherin-like n=1 Tax=Pongo pygmaeus TaxID=9600 RepID=UPI00300C8FA2